MHRSATLWIIILIAVTFAVSACSSGSPPPNADPPGEPEDIRSPKATVQFKGNRRLNNDLARALGLPGERVCTELGRLPCTSQVHVITLGGVEPYRLGLQRPLAHTSATTPIAVDRVVMFACRERADEDLADPGNALIYAELSITGGRLAVDEPSVANAIDRLYKRGLLRPATAAEVGHLRQLYRDIEATDSQAPARDWAVLACFAVMSSMEQLFY
ncbi:MAG: hypothetical protein MJE77_36285 [Proteobacteria bacterium]|nr:hypothetical protein [Pseudomonadota bacterium]